MIPIAISLALDYCIPTATACLAEYAVRGSLSASLLIGFLNGYNDPLSSAFTAGTYAVDTDVTSFICNRAGMLLGAAIACRPTSVGTAGVKAVANVASREITGTVISKAETAMIKSVKASLEKSVRTAAQKTAQVAERNLAKGGVVNGPGCSAANAVRLKNSLAAREIASGHAFEKHVLTQGEFPGLIRTREQFSNHIENVLNNPSAVKSLRNNRTGYWHQETGTVIIRNPHALDGGTTFQPRNGFIYYQETLR